MPRRPDPERAAFISWTQQRRSVKHRSAETYARRAWTLRDMTPEARASFLADMSPSMRGDYATAWRIYQTWEKSRGRKVPGIKLPKPPACPLPDAMFAPIFAILQVASGLGARGLAKIRWADVRQEGPEGRSTIHFEGKAYAAPANHLQMLEAWGRPDGPYAPVIPGYQGSNTFIPPYVLTSWVRGHRAKAKPKSRRRSKSKAKALNFKLRMG